MFTRVVLVRPRNPLNIGAAARAMANFGVTDLAVLKPYEPVWRETISAVGAEKLVLSAVHAHSLEDAVKDCHLVFGTSAVRDRRLERPLVPLPDLGSFLEKQSEERQNLRVAFVFGPEKTGLSNRYLQRCNVVLTIPTAPECPSLNLSHAVAVVCYELSRFLKAGKGQDPEPNPAQKPARRKDVDRLTEQAARVFDAAGYLSFFPARKKMEKIRRILLQWRLKEGDTRILYGLFRHLLKKMKGPVAALSAELQGQAAAQGADTSAARRVPDLSDGPPSS